jgi:carboxylesterase
MWSTLRTRFRAVRRKGISPGSPEAYFFALACAGVAATVGFAFSYFIDDITLSIAFYPAVFIAALVGGLQAGLAVVAISMSMEWWADSQFFGDPKAALTQFFNRGLFLAAAAIIIWVAEDLRHRDQRLRQPAEKLPTFDTGVVVPLPVRSQPRGVRSKIGRLRHRLGSMWRNALPSNSYAAYFFALTCVAAATLVRIAFGWFGEDVLPLVCYYPIILLASLAGGFEAGLAAIVLSLIVVGWAFVPPYYSIGMPTPDQVVDCELFLFASLLSAWLIERHRQPAASLDRKLLTKSELIAPVIVSFGMVLLATLALLAAAPFLGAQYLIFGYLIPTTIVAILYGNTFALLVSFVCGLSAAYFLFPPRFNLYVDDPLNVSALIIFILFAFAASKVASHLTYGARTKTADKPQENKGVLYSGASGREQTGILLIHSVGGSPRELKTVAAGLADRGYTVLCCQLAGHGGSEEDLLASRWTDWFASAEQALAELEKQCNVVVVGGLSGGSVLALRLAALNPTRVHGLCLFAPTLRYDGWAIPWYSFLLMLGVRAPFLRRMRFTDPPPYGIKDEATRAMIADTMHADESAETSAHSTSLGTLQESHWLVRDVIRRLSSIKAPAIIIHPREDDISDLSNTIFLQRRLGGLVECWVLDDSYHLITIDRQRDVVMNRTADFVSFVERYAVRQRPELARSRPTLVGGREYPAALEPVHPAPVRSI